MLKLRVPESLFVNITLVREKNESVSLYAGSWPKITNCESLDIILFKSARRKVSLVCNVS